MAKLPTYDSKRQLTTQQPEVMRTGAGNKEKMIGGILGVVQEAGQKWQAAINNMQETAAKAKISEVQAQILVDSANDTDINGEKNRIKAIQQAKEAVLKDISNPALRSKLNFELEHEANLLSIKIKGIYGQKKILADNLNTEALLLNYSKEGTPESDKKAFDLIQNKVAVGSYTVHQGQALFKEYRLGAVDFEIQSDTSTTQSQSKVLKDLLEGEKGKYKDLTKAELSSKIQDAKINIWRNKLDKERLDLEINTQGAFDLSTELVQGTLTESTINKMFNDSVIDAKTAAIFKNSIDQQEIEDPSNVTAEYLIKLIDNDKSSALDVLKRAATWRGSKGFSDEIYSWVVQEVSKKIERERKGLSGWDKTTIAVKNALKSLSSFASKEISGQLLIDFIQRIKGGTPPEEAKSEVIEEQLNNDIADSELTLPPQTILMISPEGKTGYIPLNNLDRALEKGYKRAD